MPDQYDHVEIPRGEGDDPRPTGTYRVVGATDGRVTLLRVTDAGGRRIHTGELVSVDDAGALDPADNPDERRSIASSVANLPETVYWDGKAFGKRLAANPVPVGVALALAALGTVGGRVAGIPDTASGALLFVGSLGLGYVGSGRL